MKKSNLLLILLLITSNLSAQQKKNTQHTTLENSFLNRSEFKIGYLGNFIWNPGLSTGVEYLWKEKIKTKEKKHRIKVIKKQWLFNGAFGISYDPRTELGIFTNYGISWRRTNTKNKQIHIQFNPLGYYRSFLGETYEVSGNNVTRVFAAGRNFYAPSISYGIGKFKKGKKLSGSYINLTYIFRTPNNNSYLPTYNIELGYRFKFKKKN